MVDWPKPEDDIIAIPLHDPIVSREQHIQQYRGMEGIIYKEARLLIHLFTISEETVKELLPAELSPGALGMAIALVAEYPNTSIGSYKEAALFVECQYEDLVGMHTAYMYIDQMYGDHTLGADRALIAGREVLGFPKTLAEINLSVEGDRCLGTVRRRGMEIMRIEAEISDPAEWPDLGTMINVRALPSPDTKGYSYRDICTTNLEYKPIYSLAGSGKVFFPPSHDRIRRVQPVDHIATYFTITDFVIPPGKTLKVL
ncbi:MAG TPA: acetoacetate decarboxylase family protein [Bacillota bacterium]|nr:acetoacetate decarboxylase family protein [Bacillota bacterium]HOB86510.1 acetoacetate decarboxylase family protein [Bacillota bacterium]HOP69944.1 acetoacetate decarboxylase family protein [Bacillota bacterium]HPT34582.1 acetoacetate decarboxylase family protein [Bacillota bacterium]HPZ64462.1 acetoacetate decarboxylase family protein [Bacillota bacterium]